MKAPDEIKIALANALKNSMQLITSAKIDGNEKENIRIIGFPSAINPIIVTPKNIAVDDFARATSICFEKTKIFPDAA